MIKKFGVLALCALTISACQTDGGEEMAAAAELPVGATLGAAEIQSELIGQRFAFTSTGGETANIRFESNGSTRLTNATFPGISSDQGTWRIQGRSLCVSWTTIRSGEENCLRYARGPDGTYTTDTGTLRRI